MRARLQEYAVFSGLPRDYRRQAAACWALLEHRLGAILDQFYDFAIGSGLMAEVDTATRARIIDRQLAHWRRLFDADFSEDYIDSVRAIGIAHRVAGVTPSEYIAGYNFMMSRMIGHLGNECDPRSNAFELARTINALVAIDMSLAVAAYGDDVVLL